MFDFHISDNSDHPGVIVYEGSAENDTYREIAVFPYSLHRYHHMGTKIHTVNSALDFLKELKRG